MALHPVLGVALLSHAFTMAPLRIRRIDFAGYLKIIGVVLLVLCAMWYASFQARNFILGPQITLNTPTESLSHEQTVRIAGNAQNITDITLNGKTIYTGENGDFAEDLVLPPGYTILTISARDRFGRTSTLTKTLVYDSSHALSAR